MSQSCFYNSETVNFEVLDIEKVPVDEYQNENEHQSENESNADSDCIKQFKLEKEPIIERPEILIVGGGMGGIGAALEAAQENTVYLTEETSWLGGQMTSQGVSALDENKYVETSGASLSYLQFRELIRKAYRETGDLTEAAMQDKLLHPGRSWVTRLSFEPKLAVALIDEILKPLKESGRLKTKLRLKAVAAKKQGEQIKAVLFVDLDSGEFIEVQASVVVDATETGDILKLADIPYFIGSDCRSLTGEAHAPEQGDNENVQDYTYPFVLELAEGENHVIEKPRDYDDFVAAGKFSFYGYHMFEEVDDESTGKKRHLLPFWTYRRLIDKELFKPGVYKSDVSMINWDSNDLRGRNFIDKAATVQRDYLALAKRVSLGFLYWLQTEAPRDDSRNNEEKKRKGYPELKLVFDVLGTRDGLSMHPYIREGRRLQAECLIREEDIVEANNPHARAKLYSDSVGIGLYPVDIHGRQEIPGAAQGTKPFQVPLSALVTRACPNYIAACKNIGVSHITNGAYRLHPVEWGIGNAAGVLASQSIKDKCPPAATALLAKGTLAVQLRLTASGAPIFWFEDVPCDHPHFQAIQIMAASGIIPHDKYSLRFNPNDTVSKSELDDISGRFSSFCKQFSMTTLSLKAKTCLNRAELAETMLAALKIFWRDYSLCAKS